MSENQNKEKQKKKPSAVSQLIRKCVSLFRKPKPRPKQIYFISGMCYNCKVFDSLTLPAGYEKKYIEWYVPRPDETLSEYAHEMAKSIDTSRPFVLVGYSFGAVIMQEMNRFMEPEKNIVISSFKSPEEIPSLFQTARRFHIVDSLPKKFFQQTDFITEAFNRLVYHATNEELKEYMTQTDPVYIRWAIDNITNWKPEMKLEHLYHIHGTEDQIFPFEQLKNVLAVEGGDHLMVIKKAQTVSAILAAILLIREE